MRLEMYCTKDCPKNPYYIVFRKMKLPKSCRNYTKEYVTFMKGEARTLAYKVIWKRYLRPTIKKDSKDFAKNVELVRCMTRFRGILHKAHNNKQLYTFCNVGP